MSFFVTFAFFFLNCAEHISRYLNMMSLFHYFHIFFLWLLRKQISWFLQGMSLFHYFLILFSFTAKKTNILILKNFAPISLLSQYFFFDCTKKISWSLKIMSSFPYFLCFPSILKLPFPKHFSHFRKITIGANPKL